MSSDHGKRLDDSAGETAARFAWHSVVKTKDNGFTDDCSRESGGFSP